MYIGREVTCRLGCRYIHYLICEVRGQILLNFCDVQELNDRAQTAERMPYSVYFSLTRHSVHAHHKNLIINFSPTPHKLNNECRLCTSQSACELMADVH